MSNSSNTGNAVFRVLNNSLAFTAGDFFYHLVNFLAGIFVARSLSTDSYGQFSFVFVYLSFFEIFVQFGLSSILTRQLSQNREGAPRILGNAILIQIALIGVSLPVAALLIQSLGYPISVQQGVLLASFRLFLTVRTVYETVFRVNLQMVYPALWNGFRSLANLALVAAAAFFHPTVFIFILAYVISGFAGLLGIAGFSRRFVSPDFRPDWCLIKGLLKESAPLVIAGYLTVLYYRVDVFMLSMMKNFSDVGYYSVATRLTETLDIIAGSLMVSLFPLLSRAYKEDRPAFEAIFTKAFRSLLLVGLPLALGGSLVARDLVVLFFGEAYARSGVTLTIMVWYTFFGFFSTLLVNILVICGKQVMDAWISLGLVLANIGLNFFLIPPYSYNGAAVSTVLIEVFGTTAMFLYLTKQPAIRLPFPSREIWPALKINAVFLPLLLGFKYIFQLPVYLVISLGVLTYALLLMGMKFVSMKDIRSYLSYGKQVLSKGSA